MLVGVVWWKPVCLWGLFGVSLYACGVVCVSLYACGVVGVILIYYKATIELLKLWAM